MKRLAPLVLIVALTCAVFAPYALAAAKNTPASEESRTPGVAIATALTTVTGIAISPLLGTSGYGAYLWLSAKDDAARARLPWYAQMQFWLPALLVVGICAAKDTMGTALPPGFKKPLDVLETIENKVSGLIAAGAVIPFAMDAMAKLIFGPGGDPSASLALHHSGLAMIQVGAVQWSTALDLLTVPFGIAVFAVVWLASHAINVLILLSPWGAIDAALKVARTALLGLIVLAATINPWIGAALSLVVILVAWLVAGWAFRLTIFGSVFCWEFLTRKRARFAPVEEGNAMFAGAKFAGVPIRTYGRLVKRSDGGLEFVYRPWLVRAPRRAVVVVETTTLAVGRGAFFSDIVVGEGDTLFSLPPRYRGHEEVLVRTYAFTGGVQPAGLRKAWAAFRELLSGRQARSPLPQLS